MSKIISFSLYGTEPKYTEGAISNAELANIIFPDWICRFYCGGSVPRHIIDKLKSYDNVEVIHMDENTPYSFMMWRFLPIDDENTEIMISRDTDSRLSYREKTCVDLFIESDKLLHSIQDNFQHDNIMGGMWGIKKNDRINMLNLCEEWNGGLEYFSDQHFLRSVLRPIFNDSYLVHCSSYLNNFPTERVGNFFVGEVFTDNRGKPYDYVFF